MKRALVGDGIKVVNGPWKGATGIVRGYFDTALVCDLMWMFQMSADDVPVTERTCAVLMPDMCSTTGVGWQRMFLNKILRKHR